MATTTNYGWTTPDDTALVKDGASAIRTLGSSIDTTTKNLNPETTLGDIAYRSSTSNVNTRLPLGTAGQVLKVNSGATAPEWSSDNAGMTNPMTTTGDTIYSSSGSTPARLGIGTSGQALTVVAGVPSWAASATSVLTTTGDTIYASAANTLARRAIGSTGQVLTVAGGIPTWATPSASIPANSSATVATSQTTTSTSYTDLATAGPAVTVTTGTKALVIVTGRMVGGSTSVETYMSYAVSGATTIAASDTVALLLRQGQGPDGTDIGIRASGVSVATLTAGSNTFTAKYKVTSGTQTFANREIFVINLA
jgi:hypothetical protein